MGGLGLTLNTAAQTLLNTQTELQTSSNNISNASNTWYSREVAVQQSDPSVLSDGSWVGTGASITAISQMRDQYLDGQVLSATSANSQYTSLSSQLQSIQSAVADSGSTGISAALGSLFSSFDALSQNPTGLSEQTGVYEAAQNLASAIQSSNTQLNQASNNLPGQINDTVNQANSLIAQIAQYNTAIAQTGGNATGQANSLVDQRYEAMDNLSQLIPVSFSTGSNGMVNVTTTDSTGPVTIVSGETGTPISTDSTITGGQLGGLLQAQTDLNGYMTQLNTFTSSLVSQVNALQTVNGGPAVFSDTTGQEASTITASTTFLTGQTTANEGPIAVNIANLQNTNLTFSDGTTSTLQGYLSNIQQGIGNDVQSANTNSSFNQSLLTQLQNQQQSYSGVSLDQEMVNVIQYQQVYQAAAKVVETVSGLMSTAISMVPAAM